MNLMSFDERIETVKKEIVAARVRENELRLRKAKNAKNVKLLNTEPNFFTASNKHGFIVMHLEEFLELPISKQRKIIKNYR